VCVCVGVCVRERLVLSVCVRARTRVVCGRWGAFGTKPDTAQPSCACPSAKQSDAQAHDLRGPPSFCKHPLPIAMHASCGMSPHGLGPKWTF
jgi:hypothetical protein